MKTMARTTEEVLKFARTLQLKGDHHSALSALADLTPDCDTSAEIEILRSVSYIALSNFRNATKCLIPLLSKSLETGNDKAAIQCFYQIARILFLQNNFREADDFLENLCMIYQSSCNDDTTVAWLHCLHGDVKRMWNAGDLLKIQNEALPLIGKAEELFYKMNCREGIAECLSNLGLIHLNLGNYAEAEAKFRESLKLFRKLGDDTNAAWQEHNIGSLLANKGNDKGVSHILSALEYMQKTENIFGLAWIYYSLAHITADMFGKRDTRSLAYYTKAIDLFEKIRDEIAGNAVLNMGFFEEISDAYQRFASIIAEDGTEVSELAIEILFDLTERAKAGMLLRQVTWKPPESNVTVPAPIQCFASISEKHHSVVQTIKALMVNAVEETNIKQNVIPVSLDTLQKQILQKNEVFISLYCAVRTIVCLIVTPDDFKIKCIENWNHCWKTIVQLLDCACDPGRPFTSEYREKVDQLAIIFRSLIEDMSSMGKKLIISPDVQLSLIPFDALPVDNKFPLLGSDITYVHSASVLSRLRRTNDFRYKTKFKMYIDSSIEEIENPQQICLNQFGMLCEVSSVCKNEAGCSNLIARIDRTEIEAFLCSSAECLHAICHGVYVQGYSDSLPAIKTGSPGNEKFLTVHDIASLQISSKLIVLSVCNSAAGHAVRGEGIDSLCNAIFVAGAQCVIAALWPILLTKTTDFNRLLFRYLKTETVAKAFSLAKNEVVKSRLLTREHEWAPFVLYGNSQIQLWR